MSIPRKVPCTVESVVDHGGRVYTVGLTPESPVPSFRPGQFLHLTVDAYDPSSFWPESRVFSIASSPGDRRRLRICYSVKGRYTTKMEDTLRVGSKVWIKLPYGQFQIDDSRDSVLIAGGTGISAFTAFLEGLSARTQGHVTLVYGVRNPALFLFREIIQSRLAAVPCFQVILFSETEDDDTRRPKESLIRIRSDSGAPCGMGVPPMHETLKHRRDADATSSSAPADAHEFLRNRITSELPCSIGRIGLDSMWSRLRQPATTIFYLSGPPAMLATLSGGLGARGIAADRIRTDSWE